MNNQVAYYETKVGFLKLIASKNYLISCSWVNNFNNIFQTDINSPIIKEAKKQLNKYFAGQLKIFDIPINPDGTKFELSVWNFLQKIPYGTVCSYKDIALNIGHNKAYRAVGTANRNNPLCIIIPCHRVINTNKQIGGYNGGTQIKQNLLELEQYYSS